MPLVGDYSLFDRDRLDSERQRITTLLRRNGYYAFNRDFLSYTADSSEGDHKIDIAMNLRPFRIQNPDGTYTYTPAANYNGNDEFTYQLCDADNDCSQATVTISIGSVNDAPVAVNDVATTQEDTPVNGTVTTNDTPSGDGGNAWS